MYVCPPDIKTQREKQRKLACKLRWTMREFDVPVDRVFNMDETAVRLFPSSDKGWAARGEKRNFVGDSKTLITITLVVNPLGGPVLQQFIFEGKTDRVHPMGPLLPWPSITHSETHWCTHETLMELIGEIDRHVPGDETHWILLMDCVHHDDVESRWSTRR